MAESNAGETTIIGADAHLKGELSFERTATLNGKFDGQINGKGDLHISENALCKADVHAGSVHIDGTIEGNLQARDTVRLNNKGTVRGDVVAAKMIMAEGASFTGHLSVGPEAAKKADTTPPPAPTTPGGGQGQQGQQRK